MSILEVGDDGILHVPGDLLPGARPHAQFELERLGDIVVLRPAGASRPFWQEATPAQRAEAFRRFAESPRPPAPDLPDEYLRRESMYD